MLNMIFEFCTFSACRHHLGHKEYSFHKYNRKPLKLVDKSGLIYNCLQ